MLVCSERERALAIGREKDHYTAGLQFDWFGFGNFCAYMQITTNFNGWSNPIQLNWRSAVQ